ncbi:MAG TPA: cardiolipin synthase [Myxococcaceae bacterium]|jgi:cardiolipin synthase|nr:cardiolipin synthase [Myxococcaceae bacterium]
MTLSWGLLYVLSEWAIRLVMLVYVPQRRSADAARAWLVLIFLVPWVGLGLYALIGRIRYPRRRRIDEERAAERIRTVLTEVRSHAVFRPPRLDGAAARTAQLVERLGDFAPMGGNQVELLPDYGPAIDRLVADIDAAHHHVHLLFYIFAADATGRRVSEAVERAARRGVSCRVLMDAVGSAGGLRRLGPPLRAAGAEVIATLRVGFFRRNAARLDLRNHRKIAVIDGKVGYVGSQNIVDPGFIPAYPNEELLARVTGPVVVELQAVLLADRYQETEHRLDTSVLLPPRETSGESVAQVLPSGPGYRHENQQALLCALLHEAAERVVITTPYFVPDEPFLQSMETAAVRGVAVHLIVPEHSNKVVTNWAQQSHYTRLLEAGIHIHLYAPHFLHAKHVTVDRSVAVVGSVNMDIRSFALDSEVSLLVYDPAVVAAFERVQAHYLARSRELSREAWRRRPLLARVAQNTARLADSLL